MGRWVVAQCVGFTDIRGLCSRNLYKHELASIPKMAILLCVADIQIYQFPKL